MSLFQTIFDQMYIFARIKTIKSNSPMKKIFYDIRETKLFINHIFLDLIMKILFSNYYLLEYTNALSTLWQKNVCVAYYIHEDDEHSKYIFIFIPINKNERR